MKKVLFIFIISLFAITSYGQNYSLFTCENEDSCVTSADSLLQSSKRQYEVSDRWVYQNRYIIDYTEVCDHDKPENVRVTFQKRTYGANPDLEIEGTTLYELVGISGKYLDVFPIWEKYIAPAADMDAISKRGYTDRIRIENETGGGQEYYFKQADKEKGVWVLSRSAWIRTIKL